MARSWTHRFAATFLALWLSLVGLEGSLAPCPMHQMAERAAEQGGGAGTMAGMAMAPGSDGAATGSDGTGHDAEPGHQSHRCSCPGSGCATPVGGLPAAPVEFHAQYFRTTAPLFRAAPSLAVPADFLLPFATAPPVGSLS
ncbi:MAG: hypothetical protein V4558_00575 [Gemmatimonadota bacterium]